MKKTLLCILALLLVCTPFTAFAKTRGDVNADGGTDAKDYMMIKRFILGTYKMTEHEKTAADINGDGKVCAKDYMIVRRYILGTYDFPTEQPETSLPEDSQPEYSQPEYSQPEKSQPEVSDTEEPTVAEQVLALVNAERAKHGLNALTLSKEVTRVAVIKAEDMAESAYFDHTSPTYGTPFEMLSDFGISYKSAGENIAAGQQTPEDVMNSWMNSEGHRANILNASYTELGVGIAYGGSYGIYWVQMFIGK